MGLNEAEVISDLSSDYILKLNEWYKSNDLLKRVKDTGLWDRLDNRLAPLTIASVGEKKSFSATIQS